ncbi:MAG: ribosome maturation factor RimM [Bacteroidales bacterium]|nr:ribosome maturation factor RimM [Clostridium sp.]MCM1203059.1 ribosome maturation factor RimM [Bacteroidales bacterium]
MEELLQVGVITSTHGVRGEVKVFPTTDDKMRFKKLKECFIGLKEEIIPARAVSCKFFKNMVILKLEGLDTIEQAEKYKQGKLFVDREHAVSLERDEYFISDLIGLTVIDEEEKSLGILTEVIPTGANDVYLVKDEDGRERLLPAIKECILNVDVRSGKMTVRLLKGMEE